MSGRAAYIRGLHKDQLCDFLSRLDCPFNPEDKVDNLRRIATAHVTHKGISFADMPFVPGSDVEKFRPKLSVDTASKVFVSPVPEDGDEPFSFPEPLPRGTATPSKKFEPVPISTPGLSSLPKPSIPTSHAASPTSLPSSLPHPSSSLTANPVSASSAPDGVSLTDLMTLILRQQEIMLNQQQHPVPVYLPAPVPTTPSASLRDFKEECSKQRVQFSGESSDRLDLFLRGIRSVRRIVRISDGDLLAVLPALLTGQAADWYEATCPAITSWNAFEAAIKETYEPADYDLLVRRDLFLRTQAHGETVDHYLNVLHNVNNSLRVPMPEEELVSLAAHNLHPQYQLGIAGRQFSSLRELGTTCRSIETARSRMNLYQPPPDRLFVEGLYGLTQGSPAPRRFNSSPRPPAQAPLAVPAQPQNQPRQPIVCHRCRAPGHMARDCPAQPIVAANELPEEFPPPPPPSGNELLE